MAGTGADGAGGGHADVDADVDADVGQGGCGGGPAAAASRGAIHAPEEVWAAYERMGDQLRRVAYRVLRDGHDAEDAVHDAVLAAYNGIHGLRDTDRLDGWLLRIARNTAATRARGRRRCRPDALAVDDTLAAGAPTSRVAHRFGSPEPPPEQAAAIRAGIESLSGKLRSTLRDRVERGLSLAEIAAEQRVTVSCVKARVARLRARLEACI